MPIVTVELWEGQPVEVKKKIMDGITTTLNSVGVPREDVNIIIKDNPKHNWWKNDQIVSEMFPD
ncbi:tautomerase family protein [Chloroflexota bacterium]